jgi:hypothetical protein
MKPVLLLAIAAVFAAGMAAACAGKESAGSGDGGGSSGSSGSNGSSGSCSACDAGCTNGLVTRCLVLDPPGCGSQSSTSFCPYGCSADVPGGCNFSPVDGAAAPGCTASAATIQEGALLGQGGTPVAVTTGSSTLQVIVATGAGAACALGQGEAGAIGSGGALTIPVPANAAGTFPATGAKLTVWKSGILVIDAESATSGSVTVNVNQPDEGGGTIGSYDVTFGSDDERGTFVAPACDICP